jgi:hypothetical protein
VIEPETDPDHDIPQDRSFALARDPEDADAIQLERHSSRYCIISASRTEVGFAG